MSFLKNLALLLLCYVYFLKRGRAQKVSLTNVDRVLVMPASRLGDMVCATPIFRAIKQKYPSCRLSVAGLQNCAEVHEFNNDVDEYVVMSATNVWSNIKLLRRVQPQVAVITTPGFESVATFFLANIHTIIGPRVVNGWSPYQTKAYRLLFPLFRTIPHRMKYYALREYLKMLEPLDIHTDDTTKHVAFSDQAEKKISEHLISKNILPNSDILIGISVSAGNKIKKWSGEKFARLASALGSRYQAVVVFIGSKSDSSETREVIGQMTPGLKVLDMAGKCSLDELKALISRLDLFISVDTGPIYVAEALNIPTVDITGPIDQNEQPPIGELHKVVHITNRRGPELFVMNARAYNELEAKRQTQEISVEMVLVAAEEIINKKIS